MIWAHLLSGVLSDVSRSRDEDLLSLPSSVGSLDVLDHPRDVVDESVTGGLRSDVRSSEGESLTGEDTREGVGVLNEKGKRGNERKEMGEP